MWAPKNIYVSFRSVSTYLRKERGERINTYNKVGIINFLSAACLKTNRTFLRKLVDILAKDKIDVAVAASFLNRLPELLGVSWIQKHIF